MAARGHGKKSGMRSETKMPEKEELIEEVPTGDEDLDAEIEKLESEKVTLEKRKKLKYLKKEVRKLKESSSASESEHNSDGELEASALQKHLENLRTGDYGETSTGSSESPTGATDHGQYTKGVIRNEKFDVPDLSNTPYKYHVYLACERGSGDSNELLAYLGKGCGLDVYKMSASLGNDMKKDIENGMLLSRCVVFLWTERYRTSEWKQYEITTARALWQSLKEDFVIVLKVTDKPFEDFGRQLDYHGNKDELLNLPSLLCKSRLQPTPHVMANIGAAYALSYYSGYLKVILPDIFQRCFKQGFACAAVDCKAHTDHQWGECECIMPAVYILIIPYSLKGPANLSEWDDKKITDEIERLCCTCTEREEYVKLKRGGLERDYSSTVHKLISDQSQPTKFRRFLAEVPNILINLNDMHERVVGLSPFKRRVEAIQFHQHLEQLIENDPACRGKVHYLFVDDTVSTFQEKIVESISELIDDKITQKENKTWFTGGVTSEYHDVNVGPSHSVTQPHDGQQTQETRSSLSPDVCNFLGYFSCQPGLHSEGSYARTFISSLCKHIEEKAGTLDLENIIKAVTEEMWTMSGSTMKELRIQDHDTADIEKPPIPTIPFVYSTLSKYVDFSQVFVPTTK